MSKKIALVIDANSLIHRAWHALPPLTAPDGRVVNAVYGFTSVLLKVLGQLKPEYLVVAWDTVAPTYRHEARTEYKAQRVSQPDEFYAQFPLAKEVVAALGGTNVEMDGYEADDLLATFAAMFTEDAGIETILLTSDRDVLQLISPRVKVMAFKKGVSDTQIYDEVSLKEFFGLTPEQIAPYKALRGDPSDNLKGIPGIGEKTATELLQKFGDLDGIFIAARDSGSEISPSVRQKLLDGEAEARLLLLIVTLKSDAPLGLKVADAKRRAADEDEVRRIFTALGFKTLLARVLDCGKVEGNSRKQEAGSGPLVDIPAKEIRHSVQLVSKDVLAFLAAAKDDGALIVRPVVVTQGSLFAEAPGLALGTTTTSLLLSAAQLKDKTIARALKDAFEDAAIKKIGHELKAAWHWMRDNGWELAGLAFDIEIAAYILAGGDGAYNLPALSAAHLGTVIPEDESRSLHEVDAIRRLESFFRDALEAEKLGAVVSRFETPLISVLAEMEVAGVLIDRPYFKKLVSDFSAEKKRLEQEMESLAGEPFNASSPQQLARILFEKLDISPKGIKRGKTGLSTAAAELEKLDGAHPIIEKISEYREVAKLLSTYVEALPELADERGRVHTTYNQALTSTGRLSSSSPNLQNIPARTELGRKIRRGFIADKGNVLLSCDYSQVELRVIAALAKDDRMLDAFRRNIDIHTATAAAIWNVPLESVTKDQRRSAKAVNFGVLYGQGPNGLARSAGIPFVEAKNFIAEYFHVYAGVRAYLDQTKALALAQGYVETLFGRRRAIPEIASPLPQIRAAAERMAINMPVQGTAADLIKLAMIEVARRLPALSVAARMLLQVHDELVFEVPENEVASLAPQIVDLMQSVEKIGVPIVVEAKAGKNWEEMKKLA